MSDVGWFFAMQFRREFEMSRGGYLFAAMFVVVLLALFAKWTQWDIQNVEMGKLKEEIKQLREGKEK